MNKKNYNNVSSCFNDWLERTTQKSTFDFKIFCACFLLMCWSARSSLHNLSANIWPACRALPHIREGRVLFQPPGNPVFARELLIYTQDQSSCDAGELPLFSPGLCHIARLLSFRCLGVSVVSQRLPRCLCVCCCWGISFMPLFLLLGKWFHLGFSLTDVEGFLSGGPRQWASSTTLKWGLIVRFLTSRVFKQSWIRS